MATELPIGGTGGVMDTHDRPQNSNRGFSLIEVMISVGVMGILSLAAAGMMTSQASDMRETQRKSEILGLKNTIISSLSVDTCTCMLKPANNTTNGYALTFNASEPDPLKRKIPLKTLYGGCDSAKHPSLALAQEGQLLLGTQTKIKIGKINVTNIRPVGALTPNVYQGDFEVNFDMTEANTTGDNPVKVSGLSRQAIYVSQRFNVDTTNPANSSVIDCTPTYVPPTSIPSTTIPFETPGLQSWVVPAGVTAINIRMVGGGGGGAGTGPFPWGSPPEQWSGGGGGSGGYSEGWKSVVPGQTIQMYVARKGMGGTAGGDNVGTVGETSWILGMQGTGGSGGAGKVDGTFGGGGPGQGLGGQVNMWGGYGGDGTGNGGQGGNGGSSAFGGGGRTSMASHGYSDGLAPGSGGGGGWNRTGNIDGGNGQNGAIYISY